MKKCLIALLPLLLIGCTPKETPPQTSVQTTVPGTTIVETTAPETMPLTIIPTTPPTTIPEDADFVRVLDYLPNAAQYLPYATEDNFTGRVIYDFTDAYLRYGTVKKLQKVNEDLALLGLTMKIWDGFRPVSAQFRLWEAVPDPTYVANPNVGFSSHSRGNTIDLTLIDLQGNELEMPTGFDDFSAKADRDYTDCSEGQRANAEILEAIMEKHGFKGYAGEWWHFSDTQDYPVEDVFCPH